MPGYAGGGFAGSTPWYTRQEARGMVPHGMLGGSGMGRTDNLPINVPSGAYVVPADIVSGIGQGNSNAGSGILSKAFSTGPLGMAAMHGKGGFGGPKNIAMGKMKMPMGSSIGSALTKGKTPGFQGGGPTDLDGQKPSGGYVEPLARRWQGFESRFPKEQYRPPEQQQNWAYPSVMGNKGRI